MAVSIGTNGYKDSLRSLVPPGIAWKGEKFLELIDAFAVELARFEGSATYLQGEVFPATTEDLLPDWERLAGLPDKDFPLPADIEARRQTLISRLSIIASPTKTEIERVALAGGFVIRLDEIQPFRVGISSVGDPVAGNEWLFIFYVNTFAGLSANEQIRLISIVKRFKPAHTVAVFDFRDTRLKAGGRCGVRLVTF